MLLCVEIQVGTMDQYILVGRFGSYLQGISSTLLPVFSTPVHSPSSSSLPLRCLLPPLASANSVFITALAWGPLSCERLLLLHIAVSHVLSSPLHALSPQCASFSLLQVLLSSGFTQVFLSGRRWEWVMGVDYSDSIYLFSYLFYLFCFILREHYRSIFWLSILVNPSSQRYPPSRCPPLSPSLPPPVPPSLPLPSQFLTQLKAFTIAHGPLYCTWSPCIWPSSLHVASCSAAYSSAHEQRDHAWPFPSHAVFYTFIIMNKFLLTGTLPSLFSTLLPSFLYPFLPPRLSFYLSFQLHTVYHAEPR